MEQTVFDLIKERRGTVTLGSDSGRIRFRQVAGVVHEGSYYLLLRPVKRRDAAEPTVFRVLREGEKTHCERITDEELVGAVLARYKQIMG